METYNNEINISDYPAGSEWRRWDLHVHTPDTNKNDQYEGHTSSEKWENFYKSISRYVGDGSDPQKAISVIGITDYVTLDNYKKVCKDNKLPSCIKLIIPNVEMRIVPVSGQSPVNVHFLFEPSIIENLDTRFFYKLEIKHAGIPYHPIQKELLDLGRAMFPEQKDEKTLIKAAVERFIIPWEQIDKLFQNDPELRKHVFIGITNNSKDGLSGVGKKELCEYSSGKQTDLYLQSIYSACDMIFSATPSDINYFLGKKNNCPKQSIIEKYGSLKPCIIGSDAHDNNSLFEPAGKRYCWIKADPTFNGLKQILFEPEDRVRIQETEPDKKENYFVIDSIELNIAENSENDDQKIFSKTAIPLNKNLNCIIGGKSTGKSLLLHSIANSIDPSEVRKREGDKQVKRIIKKSIFTPDFSIKWKDGTVSKSGSNNNGHKIIYIPQTYLNRSSESDDEFTDIHEIIRSIVLKKDANHEACLKMDKDIDSINKQTQLDIIALLNLQKEINELKEQEKEIGSKEGILSELKKNQQRRNSFSKELSISDKDIQRYEIAEREDSNLNLKIKKLKNDKVCIENIENIVQKLNYASWDLSEANAKLLNDATLLAVEKANESWQYSKAQILSVITKNIESYERQIENNKNILTQLSEQIKHNKELNELTDLLKIQQEKINSLNDLNQKIKDREKKVSVLVEQLSELFELYKSIHEEYADFINNNIFELKDDDELKFIVRTPFCSSAFVKLLCDDIYQVSLKNNRSLIDTDNFDIASLTKESIATFIKKIISRDIKLMKGITPEDFLRSFLKDWYISVFSVEMGDDTIATMSPGKKALALLKILIELEDSKCPILIDQPEDDLDNRSIYSELVPFIRSRKINRQIILVTHNANIVLGADAEEVIVANQDGVNTPNHAYKFEYVTGSIEHNSTNNILNGELYKSSIQQHICDILEGGKEAFKEREKKYTISH